MRRRAGDLTESGTLIAMLFADFVISTAGAPWGPAARQTAGVADAAAFREF
jgi:hypothetical protein